MPERFGGYEVERRLGAGGMAEVFLAQRRGPEGFAKRVALKRVLPGYNSDPEFVRLFQDEARLAARLDHPHIAGIHDFGEIEGTWYMAMEYVDGSDLRTLLSGLTRIGQPMPTDLVVLVAADLASALLYAHELEIDGRPAHIVHRDVTPSNVLVSVDGAIRLADFGIAKAASHGHRTRTGIVKGKVPYMPPEQALGERMDHRADLFALGVVLFECTAGKRPYVGVTELDTLQKISKGQHAPLAELAPHAPAVLVEVIERLIRPKAEERFASAADVLDALAATPPPTNARRLLGNLVRRVQREAPRSVSAMRGFGAVRTEPLDETASHTRTSGEQARRALLATTPPREDVTRALARAELEPTPPALPAGAADDRAADATRPLAAAPAGAMAPRSVPSITIPDRPLRSLAPKPAPRARDRVSPIAVAAVLGAATLALGVVAIGAAGYWVHARGARSDVEPSAAATPPSAPAVPLSAPAVHPSPAAGPPSAAPAAVAVAAPEPARTPPTADSGSAVVIPAPEEPEPTALPEPEESARPRVSTRRARERPPVEPARSAPAADPAPGRVHVVALPMGEVSIDGRELGSAPVGASLRPGRHVVVVRNGELVERRTVEIASDRTERIIVRFALDR